MNDLQLAGLLKSKKLRVTKSRKEVLAQLVLAKGQAISSNDIEQKLDQIDRITLYRMLITFEEVGIIHRIVDGAGKVKYATCSDDCGGGHHVDDHIHFYCQKCETTSCLSNVSAPAVHLPKGYQVANSQFVVAGTCPDCPQD